MVNEAGEMVWRKLLEVLQIAEQGGVLSKQSVLDLPSI
jgi:hypothetical protein